MVSKIVQTEWAKAVIGVVVGGLLAGVTAIFVSERQLELNAREQQRQRDASAALQREALSADTTERLRVERRAAYAEFVRQLGRVFSAMQSARAAVYVLHEDRGQTAARLAESRNSAETDLRSAQDDFELATATVELVGGTGVRACSTRIDLALSYRSLLLAHALGSARVAAAAASVGSPTEGPVINIDERLRDGEKTWSDLYTELKLAFVRVAQEELNTATDALPNVCTAITVDPKVIGGE